MGFSSGGRTRLTGTVGENGRFGLMETFRESPNPARWESHAERLAYYRGHREGRRVREELSPKDCA
jgi:hypothetical protein